MNWMIGVLAVLRSHWSNEKRAPGCLVYIGHDTSVMWGLFHKP